MKPLNELDFPNASSKQTISLLLYEVNVVGGVGRAPAGGIQVQETGYTVFHSRTPAPCHFGLADFQLPVRGADLTSLLG